MDELHQLYALEGFLARLAQSEFADGFVLKGGVLLAAFGHRRPTRDVDLFARDLSNDAEAMLARTKSICSQPLDDGLVIDVDSAVAEVIRDDDEYAGVRVSVAGTLSIARIAFHIDVNVGDPVWPEPQPVSVPRILGGTLAVLGYPLPMVFAEKIITMLERGVANTRWRDFTDVYTLSGERAVDAVELRGSLTAVAAYRQVAVGPLASALSGFAEIAQPKWSAWRRKQRLQDRLPAEFSEVLESVYGFADPVLGGTVFSGAWGPAARAWTREGHEL